MFPAGGTMADTNGPELVQEIILKAASDQKLMAKIASWSLNNK